jgi:Contractile injection system tube protein
MEKAIITNLDDPSIRIQCQFNPTDLSLSKSGTWQSGQESQQESSTQKFGGSSPASLKVKLLFDTYAGYDDRGEPNNAPLTDVRRFTSILWDMMVPRYEKHKDTKNCRPARVSFQWGQFIIKKEFFIESLTEQLTLFTKEGIPVRSSIDLSLKEIHSEKYEEQKPKSEIVQSQYTAYRDASSSPKPLTASAVTSYTTQENDSITKIAHTKLGDANRWREIMSLNDAYGLDATSSRVKNKIRGSIKDLRAGTSLKIPE